MDIKAKAMWIGGVGALVCFAAGGIAGATLGPPGNLWSPTGLLSALPFGISMLFAGVFFVGWSARLEEGPQPKINPPAPAAGCVGLVLVILGLVMPVRYACLAAAGGSPLTRCREGDAAACREACQMRDSSAERIEGCGASCGHGVARDCYEAGWQIPKDPYGDLTTKAFELMVKACKGGDEGGCLAVKSHCGNHDHPSCTKLPANK